MITHTSPLGSPLDPQQKNAQPLSAQKSWLDFRASIGLLDFFSLLVPVVWVEDGVDMSQPLSNQRLSPPTFQAFVALKLGLLFRQDIISGMALTFGIIVKRYSTVDELEEQKLLLCALSLLIVASMQPFEEVTDDALSPLLSVHGYQILTSR